MGNAPSNPDWNGISFGGKKNLIRTWFHEKNLNALESTKDEARKDIQTIQSKIQKKEAELVKVQNFVGVNSQRTQKLEEELQEMKLELSEFNMNLQYLNAESVNSAGKSTLQCEIVVEIDEKEQKELLCRHTYENLARVFSNALLEMSWEEVNLNPKVIGNLIGQQLKTLDEKVEKLIDCQSFVLTNWKDFKENAFEQQRGWLKENNDNLNELRVRATFVF